jgi:hypothetical protein
MADDSSPERDSGGENPVPPRQSPPLEAARVEAACKAGPVNVCAPNPCTNEEFTSAIDP